MNFRTKSTLLRIWILWINNCVVSSKDKEHDKRQHMISVYRRRMRHFCPLPMFVSNKHTKSNQIMLVYVSPIDQKLTQPFDWFDSLRNVWVCVIVLPFLTTSLWYIASIWLCIFDDDISHEAEVMQVLPLSHLYT